jgi:eukaryotic-like serine/threonine-protein kinase
MTEPALDRLAAALADRYRLERELGQGGMATVYLAHDVRHDRPVALKVLRPELAAILGGERFLAEIKTTANLQHPHILSLFDSGEADGLVFYVMPYVEGESLRDRLAHERQLPVEEAIRIATEVAGALDYAHRHGVVHRDIKPENILLHEGQALVADFGIALAASRTGGGTRLTETGMSLGTPHYMAPEQAMGEKEITPKADLYALGCVLYEMLAGEPPFTGPSAQAIIAQVLTEAPRSLVVQRHTVPPHVEAAVLKALEKLPADRFASAADFAEALTHPGLVPTTSYAAAAAGPGARGRLRARLQLPIGILAGLVVGALAWSLLHRAPPAPVTRYGLALPASEAPDPTFRAIPSPDGAYLAYVGPAEGGIQLWVKTRSSYDARPLPGTLGASDLAWSPDGQWIAFAQGRNLRKIPVVGGASIALGDSVSPDNPGLAWLDDGSIVFVRLGGWALQRIPGTGGIATTVWADSAPLLFPTPLPGGRGVLFTRCASSCNVRDDVWALDLHARSAHRVLAGATIGWYVAPGYVVYVQPDGGMFAVPFDLGTSETRGSPTPVLDSVLVLNAVYPLVSLSRSGTLVMRSGAALTLQQRYTVVWVDRAGRETPVDTGWTFRLTSYGANVGWALSPDGARLAIGLNTDAGDDIWVKQLPHGAVSRVTYDSASEYRPRWTPDGRSVLFGSNRPGPGLGGLYQRRWDGTGSDSLVLRAPGGIYEGAWSPDRTWLLFRTGGTIGQVGGRDIVGIRPGVDSAPVPVVATSYDEEAFALSPDGRWLAYQSNETGRDEVFIRPFPSTSAAKIQVSNGGGIAPLWARSGRELFYVNAHRDMTSVTVGPGAVPRLGTPRVLFHMPDDLYLVPYDNYTPFDVAPDGRFIMARDVSSAEKVEAPLIVVDHWFTELRIRLEGGR